MKTIITDDYEITYDDSPEMAKAVFDKLIEWYIDTELFSGESICQSDTGNIEAPMILSDIADDVIKFDEKWL